MDSNHHIQQAIRQWSHNPIGTTYSEKSIGELEWFDDIAKHRYDDAPWMLKMFNVKKFNKKRVLEIGVGSGTDHVSLARTGANITGVDVTFQSIELTSQNMILHGYSPDLYLADAQHLPFQDNTFDVVFSFGVLHHIPHIENSIKEIYRVLKPGGEIMIGLYHKHSLFYLLYIIKSYIKKIPLKNVLQAIEIGQQEIDADIIVNLYTRKDLHTLFRLFKKRKIIIRHSKFFPALRDFLYKRSGNFLKIIKFIFKHIENITSFLDELVGRFFGFYIIISGKK